MTVRCTSILVTWMLVPVALAFAAPPRVINATPDDGDGDVDPGLKEIRIEFDQDMDTAAGYSICGGGPQFPEVQGKPRWEGKRTLVLPVKLQPNHDYVLSVNCPSAGNCRSAAGESAVPYPIRFTTAGDSAAAPQLSPDDNKQAIKELRKALNDRYAYRELRGVDWDAALDEHAAALTRAKTPRAFADKLAKVLGKAEDVHIWIQVGDSTIATHQRRISPNWNADILPSLVPQWQEPNHCVRTGRFDDGIGYIMITSWTNDCSEGLEAAFAALNDFADAPGLIIDVRPNSGGNEVLARDFAGCFIDQPAAYCRHRSVAPGSPGGFTDVQDRVLEPRKGRPRYRGPVAVLIGPNVMSSCESFVLMMQQSPTCTLVGATTYGSSGNPQPVELSNGVTVFLPSWQHLLLDGTLLETAGIKPDIAVDAGKADLQKGDPVIEAARRKLSGS